jgi:superfamily II DNA/RNA helicase
MGMAEWLCDRAESLGYRFPTAIQRRSSLAFFKKRDVVIQAQTGSGKTLAYLMPTVDNMDFVARRMLQILIIVPSRELTIQTVMLAFRLLGGNVNAGVPGDPGNMYNYKGPQGLKVVGVFEEEHVLWEGFADVAEIVVGTPDLLVRMKQAGKLEVDLAQTIIADEADQLFEQFPDAMDALLEPSPYAPVMEDRQIVLCGVNVPSWVVDSGVRKGYLRSPLEVSMGTPGRVPPDVSHRRLVVPRVRKLVALARQIRADLKNAGRGRAAAQDNRLRPLRGGGGGGGGALAKVPLGPAQARGAPPRGRRGGAHHAGLQEPEDHAVALYSGRRARPGHARGGLRVLAGRSGVHGELPAPIRPVRSTRRKQTEIRV